MTAGLSLCRLVACYEASLSTVVPTHVVDTIKNEQPKRAEVAHFLYAVVCIKPSHKSNYIKIMSYCFYVALLQ